MPRKYIRKRVTCHSPEKIANAVQELKAGLPLKMCMKKFKICYSVLRRHYRALEEGTVIKKRGGQTVLSEEEEAKIALALLTCVKWGYTIESYDLRTIVKSFLDRKGVTIPKFQNNMPGYEFVKGFLQRHKDVLPAGICQRGKRSSKAKISSHTILEYIHRLQETLYGVPPENIINYNEVSFTDNPHRTRSIMKRIVKYPERSLSSVKSSTTVMFTCTGSGEILAPYVVYKAMKVHETWTTDGPPNTVYNRSITGWFDARCFEDWLLKIILPRLKNMPGKKVLIGDVMSTHLTVRGIKLCEKYNIEFVFVPRNTGCLTQPLQVALFHPLMITWQNILMEWDETEGYMFSALPKMKFPDLLYKLIWDVQNNLLGNVAAGFEMCGIIPIDQDRILQPLSMSMSNASMKRAFEACYERDLMDCSMGSEPSNMTHHGILHLKPGKSLKVVDLQINDESYDDSSEDESYIVYVKN